MSREAEVAMGGAYSSEHKGWTLGSQDAGIPIGKLMAMCVLFHGFQINSQMTIQYCAMGNGTSRVQVSPTFSSRGCTRRLRENNGQRAAASSMLLLTSLIMD
ncbi:jg2567 [Pararge aegeria aegeria]|uniref:Jg2567 protein n=1 Tax=Pararge aegeria aegeria TaxID=348720 RepID=A0A8S4QXH2_9NEOP|nr:jg2567 [Pararge aegeria aegeria]